MPGKKRRRKPSGLDYFFDRIEQFMDEALGQQPQRPNQAQTTRPAVEIDPEEFALYQEVMAMGFRYALAKYHPEGKEPDNEKMKKLTALKAQFKERGII
ncbi:MAG: hypothetical protein IPK75_20405 [Acidobacteria bacterium]|nr:hypothetical protein [Acidobacteriota bacterium]